MSTVDLDLRKKYLRAGKSRRGLAAELDVTEAVLRRFENGEGVHPRNARLIAEYLGVDITDLPQFADELTEPAA
jgi:transcriptional regulator with XRE-family HTH domain